MSAILDKLLSAILLVMVKTYRYAISPLLPASCRFYPTCSSYAIEALRLHGGLKGGWLTVKRVCRCHPWGGSGINFVPLPLCRYRFCWVANGYVKGFGVWYQSR